MDTVSAFSMNSAYIEGYKNGKLTNKGSGFWYTEDETHYFLVSNWHVFTNRNPLKPEEILTDTDSPTHLKIISYFKLYEFSDWKLLNQFKPTQEPYKTSSIGRLELFSKYEYKGWTQCVIDWVIFDEKNQISTWYQHSEGYEKADIAILKIPKNINYKIASLNFLSKQHQRTGKMSKEIGINLSVLGHPFGKLDKFGDENNVFPIMKQGNLASEFELNFQNKKQALIDIGTTEGMSGSPVFQISRGGYFNNQQIQFTSNGTFFELLGVYGGRYGIDNHPDKRLGIFWKTELIEEIIHSKSIGNHPYQNIDIKKSQENIEITQIALPHSLMPRPIGN